MKSMPMDQTLLKKLQITELEILIKFDKFCSSHEIKYSLFAGTAIGAVRHKGFIPWDDDIDIVMTRKEYNRFIEAIADRPIEGLSVDSPELNENCSISHAKLIKNGTMLLSKGEYEDIGNHGIWVDIFPLDKVTDETKKKVYKIGKQIILLTRARTKNKNDSIIKRVIRFLVGLIPSYVVKRRINNYLDELMENDQTTNENYKWTELAATYTFKYLFDGDMMEKMHRTEYEGYEFLIVDDYDSMLRQMYGDYMKLPPESERQIKHQPVKIVF